MGGLQTLTFVAVAAAFLGLGIRNGISSLSGEQQRFRQLSENVTRSIVIGGLRAIFLGLLLAYSASSVPNSIVWQVFAGLLIITGCVGMIVTKLGGLESLEGADMPPDDVLRRRVTVRRRASAMLILVGLVWLWNGAAAYV